MRFEPIDLSVEELEQLVEQTGIGPLPPEGQRKLGAAVETLKALAELLAQRDTTIQELRDLLLGQRTTEKTKKVLGDFQAETANGEGSASKKEGKKKGHGRNGAARYAGAPKVPVPHAALKPKDRCPECLKGKARASRTCCSDSAR